MISTDSSDLHLYVEEVLAIAAKASKTGDNITFDTLGVQLTHQKAIENIAKGADNAKLAEGLPTISHVVIHKSAKPIA